MSLYQTRAIPAAVHATHAHESRSERYGFIPTNQVVEALSREGFEVAKSRVQNVRDASRRGFERHELRLRPAGQVGLLPQVGTVFPEIILTNSHDGSSGFRLDAGLHRLVCSNGLTVAQGEQARVSIPHRGSVETLLGRVIEGTFQVLDDANLGVQAARDWSQIELHPSEQEALATAAIVARWGLDEKGNVPGIVTPSSALRAVRWDDKAPTLWNTYNRLQENLIEKGGIRGRASTGRRLGVRAVTGINESGNLNRALWILAQHTFDAKTGRVQQGEVA